MRTKHMLSLVVAGLLLAAAHSADAAAPTWANYLRFDTMTTAQGLPSDKVLSVVDQGDRIWAGTEGGLALIEGGVVRKTFGTGDGLPFPVVSALAVAPTGDLWVGTLGGLARYSAGHFEKFTQLDSGLANDVIYGLAVEGPIVWVATAAGLSRYDTGTRVWSIFDTTNTLMHEPWCYAVTARDHMVYTAVWGSGVIVRDDRTGQFWEHRDPDKELEIDLFKNDGLIHDVSSAIAYDNGVMWVGSYFGLSRYDGHAWRTFTGEDSPMAGSFVTFLAARGDVVWIVTDQGFSRFDSTRWSTWHETADHKGFEVREVGADGVVMRTPLGAGAGPRTGMSYGITVDRNGGLWVATASGLSHSVPAGGK